MRAAVTENLRSGGHLADYKRRSVMRMLGRESGGLSQDQLKGLLEVCDPASTGLVSIDYLTSLAAQHYKTKDEAERIVRRLDPRGRGVLSYKEFCIGVSSIFRKAGGRDNIMMAPSVEQRCTANGGGGGTDTSKTSTGIYLTASTDDVTLSSNESNNDKLNSRCSSMSEGESYECYGEVEMDTSTPNHGGGDVLQRSPNGNSLRRNTWLRTSLRRTTNNHETLPNRRWGSFRHTSGKRLAPNNLTSTQLHRSSSFNSSGRSSTCDTADDVYSDVSLEEDVLDLNHKV